MWVCMTHHPLSFDPPFSSSGKLFSYGGHLCSSSKGELPFFYSNAVNMLDLAAAKVKVPQGACRIKGRQLPRQRGQGEASMLQEEL